MQCPRCGFDQPDSDECIGCGIVISKYLASVGDATEAEAPRDAFAEAPVAKGYSAAHAGLEAEAPHDAGRHEPPTTGSATIAPTGLFQRHSKADEPIGRTAFVIRALAALACLGIAILMVINGRGLVSWWPYIIMVFFASAALWGLTTLRQEITLQQFASEMAVLVVFTLVLRAASPEMFEVESEQAVPSATIKPRMPQTALGRFTTRLLDFLEAGSKLTGLEGHVPDAQWNALTKQLDFEDVQRRYALLSTDDQTSVYDVWKRLKDFGPLLSGAIDRHTTQGEAGVDVSIPEAERKAVLAELKDARARADRLRARILIYPTAGGGAVKTDYP